MQIKHHDTAIIVGTEYHPSTPIVVSGSVSKYRVRNLDVLIEYRKGAGALTILSHDPMAALIVDMNALNSVPKAVA
jgi:hypothetical protein